MKKWFALLYFAMSMLLPSISIAGDAKLIQWHSTNIQLLRGYDFELGVEERTISTFEHVSGWVFGDIFTFADLIWPDGDDFTYYAEFSPRFSLSKISGRDFSTGIIKDVLVSTTIEKPKDQQERYLYGAAVDFNIPGFAFFNSNYYVRDNPNLEGKTWQITLAWKRPFKLGHTSWVTEGFADFFGSEGRTRPNQLIVPRLLVDIGEHVGLSKNKLWSGIEYSYWHNKFGVDGVTESVVQLQIKWEL